MIKDLLVSFRDNIKSKSTNPILGTYIIIWCVRNWRLVYSLLFFDEKTNLTERIAIISSYYTFDTFFSDLLINILWAVGVLIVTYMLINLSRLIVNVFERKLTPWIYKITDENSVVLKSDYNFLEVEKQDLEMRLEKERESKGKLKKEIDSLEEKIQNLYADSLLTNQSYKDEKPSDKTSDDNITPIDILYGKIKTKGLVDDYLKLGTNLENSNIWDVQMDENIKFYNMLGLIKIHENEYDEDTNKFIKTAEITSNGKNVLNKARITE